MEDMEKREKPSQEIAKADKTKAGNVFSRHNLTYRYTNEGYGIVGQNCNVEIGIFTDLPFSEIAQEFAKASAAVLADLNQSAGTK